MFAVIPLNHITLLHLLYCILLFCFDVETQALSQLFPQIRNPKLPKLGSSMTTRPPWHFDGPDMEVLRKFHPKYVVVCCFAKRFANDSEWKIWEFEALVTIQSRNCTHQSEKGK